MNGGCVKRMGSEILQCLIIRYRGFVLLEQPNQSWLVRPERSPMVLLPFRARNCSLLEIKAILDKKLSEQFAIQQAA